MHDITPMRTNAAVSQLNVYIKSYCVIVEQPYTAHSIGCWQGEREKKKKRQRESARNKKRDNNSIYCLVSFHSITIISLLFFICSLPRRPLDGVLNVLYRHRRIHHEYMTQLHVDRKDKYEYSNFTVTK